MDQDASSDERAAVWAKFGKAVAEQDYDTTQALFDAGQLGGLYLKDELNLAWHHPEQLICLQNSGTDASYISDPQDLHSIDDIKALQEEGLDLRRSGHLYLQDFVEQPAILAYLLSQGSDINRTDCTRTFTGRGLAPGRIDTSLHVLDKAAALGDVDLFNRLVSQGADPSRSEALHRASKCHDEAKSVAMVSCLIEQHNMSTETKLHAGYHEGLDRGAERGTPLCSAIFNRNLPIVSELLRHGGDQQDLHSAISTATGGPRVEYFEPALLLLLEAGGASAQKVLRQSIFRDNLHAAALSLEHGADAALALREQIEEDKLARAQDANPPKTVEATVYYQKMSQEMKSLLKDQVAQKAALDEASKL